MDQEFTEKLTNKVLGYLWGPRGDLIGIHFNLMIEDYEEFKETNQTQRSLLPVGNKIYSPLGLDALYTIKLKLLMKETLSIKE